MVPSGNIQGGFKLISLMSMKNITRQFWNIIPMPGIVIYWVNLLGKHQQELFVFADRKGRIVGDGDVELI